MRKINWKKIRELRDRLLAYLAQKAIELLVKMQTDAASRERLRKGPPR